MSDFKCDMCGKSEEEYVTGLCKNCAEKMDRYLIGFDDEDEIYFSKTFRETNKI
ncbi:TPA: hypothetical protein ACF35N_004491 [Vibrio parahaemolyticus]